GSAIVAKALRPELRVIGVEPAAGDDTYRSLRAGERVLMEIPHRIADGQAGDMPGELTFEINKRLVDEIVLVSDEEILDAMRFALDRLKLDIEPSRGNPLHALLGRR